MAEEAKPNTSYNVSPARLTRREFLKYAWLATLSFNFVGSRGGVSASTSSQANGSTPNWPIRNAVSPNNFMEHFDGVLDSAKWNSNVSGSGTVQLTDSRLICTSPSPTSGVGSAFVHYKIKLNKQKRQLWTICVNRATGTSTDFIWILNKSTAPGIDTFANIDAISRIRAGFVDRSGSQGLVLQYFDSAHTVNSWDGNLQSWIAATDVETYGPTRNDDYYIVGLEIDGVTQRFRLMAWCKAYTSGYTFDQGYGMFALTDWVNWSNLETTTDLWLCMGNIYADHIDDLRQDFEWVRYSEAPDNQVVDTWVNQSDGSTNTGIRHHYSIDGMVFIPEDRTTLAITQGSTYDDFDVTEPMVASDGINDFLFYAGASNIDFVQNICLARAVRANPQNGPWSKSPNNPILSANAPEESYLGFAYVFKDLPEPDLNQRWKLIYSALNSSDRKWRTFLATAPDPPDASIWTRQGLVLDVGGAGAHDENGARDCVVIWYNGQYEVWYAGMDARGYTHLLRATGASLTALTKDSAGSRLQRLSNGDTPLTADLTGRIVTVSSTAGFVADSFVVLDQDNDIAQFGRSRVRKILSPTQLELYHGLDGFTTAVPARVAQIDSVRYLSPRAIVRVGAEWWFYINMWGTFDQYDGPNYAANTCQLGGLWKHGGTAPADATPTQERLVFPCVSPGNNGDSRTAENMAFVLFPKPSNYFLPLIVK